MIDGAEIAGCYRYNLARRRRRRHRQAEWLTEDSILWTIAIVTALVVTVTAAIRW